VGWASARARRRPSGESSHAAHLEQLIAEHGCLDDGVAPLRGGRFSFRAARRSVATKPIKTIKSIVPLENLVFSSNPTGFIYFGGSGVKTRSSIIAVLAAAAVVAAGCGGASDEKGGGDAAASTGDDSKGTLSLVAYSTPQVVYDEIIPAFQATPEGKGLAFKTSFGASGDQARAVEAGQKADVVTFSTEPDMTRLVDAGLVEPTWKDG
jgi:hypothetical protein